MPVVISDLDASLTYQPQADGNFVDPVAVELANGNVVRVWVNAPAAGAFSNVGPLYAAVFDPIGNQISRTITVENNFVIAEAQRAYDVVATPSGGFTIVVASQDNNTTPQPGGLSFHSYSADGTVLTERTLVAAQGTSAFPAFTLAALNDGRYVYAANAVDANNAPVIIARILNADGTTASESIVGTPVARTSSSGTTIAGSPLIRDAVTLSDGRVVVLWDDVGRVYGRTLSAAGEPTGAQVLLGSTATGIVPDINAIALPNGGYAVAWTAAQSASDNDVAVRVVGADGSLGVIARVNNLTAGNQTLVELALVGTDRFVAVYTSGDGTHARLFDFSATALGEDTLISSQIIATGVSISNNLLSVLYNPGATGQFSDLAFITQDGVNQATAGGDTLTGTAAADTLNAGAGDDLLNGGAGDDSLTGGAGNDVYLVDSAADLTYEDAGGGRDLVIANVAGGGETGVYLYANVDDLILRGTTYFGVGNDLHNSIAGNDRGNLLIGGAGDDVVNGEAGNDSVFGESGNDRLWGGSGIDYIVGGIGDDYINGGNDADAIYGEDGNDILDGGDGFVTDIFTGGAGDDILYANSGRQDYDLIDGGAGNDTYYVDTGDDLTFEAANGGTDLVIADIAGTNTGVYLYANVENLELRGTTAFGVGNELNNRLSGNAVGNYLLGGAGDDQLNGFGGDDVLFGEAGADLFIVRAGNGNDVIGDFQRGVDRIELTGYGVTSFAQLQSLFVQDGAVGGIRLPNGELLILQNVQMNTLTAGDFSLG